MCFVPTLNRIGCKQQFVVVRMEKNRLTAGFDRDAKVEGWRAMSEEGKYFLKLSDLLFMKQLPSFFSTEL